MDENKLQTLAALRALHTCEYYTPTKPLRRRFRAWMAAILIGVSFAAGMFCDLEFFFFGAVVFLIGLDAWIFNRIHGWYWRLTDKYLMLSGLAVAAAEWYSEYHYTPAVKHLGDHAFVGFIGTLGILYPLMMLLEMGLLKLRCGRPIEAEQAEVLLSVFCNIYGSDRTEIQHCPVYRIWRDGQEYVCDEWFQPEKIKKENAPIVIRVHPRHAHEIYDNRRVKPYLKRKALGWLIYNWLMIPALIAMIWEKYSFLIYLAVLSLIICGMAYAKREQRREENNMENGGIQYDRAGSKGADRRTDGDSDASGT